MHDMFVFVFFNLLQHCPELGSLVVAPCWGTCSKPPPTVYVHVKDPSRQDLEPL